MSVRPKPKTALRRTRVKESSRLANDLEKLKTVLVISPSLLKDDDVRGYLENSGESGGGPVENIDRLNFDRWTCVVHFRSQEDAVNVVRREKHTVGGWPLLLAFLYDPESRCVYCGSNTVSWLDGDAVTVPFTDTQTPSTVLVTGIEAAGSAVTTGMQIERDFEGMGYDVVTAYVLLSAGIAFVRFVDGQDARQVANKKTTRLGTGDGPGKTSTVKLFLYGGTLSCDTEAAGDREMTDAPGGPRTTQSDEATGEDCLVVPSGSEDGVENAEQEGSQDELDLLPTVAPASRSTGTRGTLRKYTGQVHSVLKQELAKMKAEIKAELQAEMQANFEVELRLVENRFKRDLKEMNAKMQIERREMNAKIEAETSARVQGQASLQEKTSQRCDQFQTDMDCVREDIVENTQMLSEQSGRISKMKRDVTSLQNQVQSVDTQLQSLQDQVQTCKTDTTQTKSCLDKQGRMQSRMLSETQSQLTAEITTLEGEIRSMKEQMDRMQTKVTNLANNNLTQPQADREAVHDSLTVDNESSECESVSGRSRTSQLS